MTKYHYLLWRPETSIRAGGANDNAVADPWFAPFITTPCFPSYPSNHASGTSSGAEVLRRLYGEGGHDIEMTNPLIPALAGITLRTAPFTRSAMMWTTPGSTEESTTGSTRWRGTVGRNVATHVYKNNLRKE